jgi:Flp pilus assembly protein TadD
MTAIAAPARTEPENVSVDLAARYRNEAIALARQGRFVESEARCREALRCRPADIDTFNELGTALWGQGRSVEAEDVYRQAWQLQPNDYRTLNNLGMSLHGQLRMDEAAECYRASIAINPAGFQAKTNLAVVLSDHGMFDEAMHWLEQALELEPYSAFVLQNIGMNLGRQGRWHDAIVYYEKALQRDPDCAEVHRNLAYALLRIGDYQRGWIEHEWRLRCQPHPGYQINRTFWSGDSLPDRTILLHAEQGYGDILQFIRYAPMVKRRVGRVLVLGPASLLQLIARCSGVDLAFAAGTYTPVCHVHAPLMSLPGIFGTTLETIPADVPYLMADPVLVDHWRHVVAGTLGGESSAGAGKPVAHGSCQAGRPFLIGIAWQGSNGTYAGRWRSFPLAQLAPLAEVPGVRLISLQVGEGVEQIEAARRLFPVIELPGRRGRDFMETAAIMNNLDLIITPDTAVAHLAGALGSRTWIALSTTEEWRWLAGRESSLWYPTVRRFHQPKFGQWEPVFQQMADELKRELGAIAPAA